MGGMRAEDPEAIIAEILDGASLHLDGSATDPNDAMGAYLVLAPFVGNQGTMTVDASTVTMPRLCRRTSSARWTRPPRCAACQIS